MSNQKIMLAHVMAVALERGERWKVVGDSLFWRIEAATIGRAWNKCVRWMKEAHGSRNRCLRLPGLTIVHGWTELRNFEALKKHGDEIRAFFSRQSLVVSHQCEDDSTKVVGVHIRRGDYKDWNKGKYWYGNEVYERVIDEMQESLGDVRFVVFTDEPKSLSHNLAKLNELPTTAERDQWLMSKCDYLIGPPSTFTLWASFMGKVSLLHITDKDQKVRLCDFRMQW